MSYCASKAKCAYTARPPKPHGLLFKGTNAAGQKQQLHVAAVSEEERGRWLAVDPQLR